jgi:predicted metalloprotease
MQWSPGGTNPDIEDRRDESGGGGGFGGFGGGFGGIHLGIGGTIILALLSLVFRQNLFQYFVGAPAEAPATRAVPDRARDAREQPEVDFVSFVLRDVQNTWEKLLPEQENRQYRHARLVLYRDAYPSACGEAQTAVGPFYCPGDEKVYLDLGFFDELKTRFGAPGEFAQAYVIAHEIGHHVQKILGIEQQVRRLQSDRPSEQNALSVRLELQADCMAGVWAHSTEDRKIIDQSDVNAALRAAGAVGDDRLQRQSQGYVNPDSFTHGSSAQRIQWFRKGLDGGQLGGCNTFAR